MIEIPKSFALFYSRLAALTTSISAILNTTEDQYEDIRDAVHW
jgi:hypothetical protein